MTTGKESWSHFNDPSTIDIDAVIANINNGYKIRGDKWTLDPNWPNVTVKALADEIVRLREVNKAAITVIQQIS